MVDWGAGRDETTAAELAPVAEVVVEHAAVGPGGDVVDVACERAAAQSVELDLREGDLLALEGGREHPMSVAMQPALDRAGLADEADSAMLGVLHDAYADDSAFLIHSPYVVHELGRAG